MSIVLRISLELHFKHDIKNEKSKVTQILNLVVKKNIYNIKLNKYIIVSHLNSMNRFTFVMLSTEQIFE